MTSQMHPAESTTDAQPESMDSYPPASSECLEQKVPGAPERGDAGVMESSQVDHSADNGDTDVDDRNRITD